ncbi:hypothetical protein JW848_09025 [Candidatus Bipolaricaulota bacterium]|nr:hypothetical protein [Candidatus Bipolaricaulota bacterium]
MGSSGSRHRSFATLLRSLALAFALVAAPLSAFLPVAWIPSLASSTSGALQGEWTVTCAIVSLPPIEPDPDVSIESGLVLLVERPPWEASMELAWDAEGLSDWEGAACWLSDPFELSASARLDGDAASWKNARLGIEYDPSEIPLELALTWDLYRDHMWLRVQAEGNLDPLSVEADVRCGMSRGYGLCFDRADVEISVPLPGATDLTLETRFSEDRGWSYTDIEFDVPSCGLPAWLDLEVAARLDSSGTTITLDPDVSLADLHLDRGVGLDLESLPTTTIELPVLVQLAENRLFNGVAIMGIQATCTLDHHWIEVATSFDPDWNKRLAGDKRFNRRLAIGWEMSIPNPTTCAGTFTGEGYAAFPSHAEDVSGSGPGQAGISGCLSTVTAAGAECDLSCRWIATFAEVEEDPAVNLALELELVWIW